MYPVEFKFFVGKRNLYPVARPQWTQYTAWREDIIDLER